MRIETKVHGSAVFRACQARVVKAAALCLVSLFATTSHAGTLGFSISFSGDEITITNTGSEAAYRLSQWTLDADIRWRKVRVLDGNADYIAPGKSLKGVRWGGATHSGIGRAAPLLLVMHDQAGSRIAQLAWQRSPEVLPQPLAVQRNKNVVQVSDKEARPQKIINSYGIVLPYEGIQLLTMPLKAVEAPPSPTIHVWSTGSSMSINTGAGQAGVWLVHEHAAGDLRLQIVPDGFARGREQIPAWMLFARLQLMNISVFVAGLGLLVLSLGLIKPARLRSLLHGLASAKRA